MIRLGEVEAKRDFLVALVRADMNMSRAAQAVGVSRMTVYRWSQRDAGFQAGIVAASVAWRRGRSAWAARDQAVRDERRAQRRAELRPIYQANAAHARAAKART